MLNGPVGSSGASQRDDFQVVALMSSYNEADIIAQVLTHLIEQRIAVYLIDDGSSDDTVAIAESFQSRGLIGLERRPRGEQFVWADILRRKEDLALELEAKWFMHHDADEFRESPWLELDLCDAVREVDRAGYNAIDFRVLNFRPTDDAFETGDDPRTRFHYYEPGAVWDRSQVKCWRKPPQRVDLVSSGGHEVVFPGRRVCPLQFLLRHYPVRGPKHGRRKILSERLPRFTPAEKDHGWHVQYSSLAEVGQFVWHRSELTVFDPVDVRRGLALTPREPDELSAATKALDHLRDASAAIQQNLTDRLANLERLLRHEREDRGRLTDELAGLEARAAAERQRAAAQQEKAALEIGACRANAQAYQVEAAAARAEVIALHASMSWRITGPFRALYRTILRLPASAHLPASGTAAKVRSVNWGDLARSAPFSRYWGFDRGLPIDRYYIQRFLERHRGDIRGRVLEVKDSGYTVSIGGAQVTEAHVIDVNPSNSRATIIADLSCADHLAGNQFDCFILTQTLHIIFDCRGALRHAARLLKPGAVLLCTIPAVSRVNDEDGGLESGDYWRMTQAAIRQLFGEVFGEDGLETTTYGNVRTCAAFLYGLAAEEMSQEDLALHDPWFPLIHCVRAVKRI